MNPQVARNMAYAGLPVAVSEGRLTGRLTLLSNGKHALDFWGGDGKPRRLVSMPQYQVKSRKKYERKSGRCITIRPTVA